MGRREVVEGVVVGGRFEKLGFGVLVGVVEGDLDMQGWNNEYKREWVLDVESHRI
jgi:hypothetical protein